MPNKVNHVIQPDSMIVRSLTTVEFRNRKLAKEEKQKDLNKLNKKGK